MHLIKIILFSVLIFTAILAPRFALALNIDYPAIPAPVEGGKFDLNCIEFFEEEDKCDASYKPALTLGNIILLLFIFSIWSGGVVAFISLIYAGFLYILSGANPGMRSKAKQQLTNVVLGISILFLTVIILNLLNPDIGGLQLTQQRGVESVEYTPPSTDGGGGSGENQRGEDPRNCENCYSCSWIDGNCFDHEFRNCEPGFKSDCTSRNTRAECLEATDTQQCIPTNTQEGRYSCEFVLSTTGGALCRPVDDSCEPDPSRYESPNDDCARVIPDNFGSSNEELKVLCEQKQNIACTPK